MTFPVREARQRFSRLLDLVEDGEAVVMARNGRPVAQRPPVRAARTGAEADVFLAGQ